MNNQSLGQRLILERNDQLYAAPSDLATWHLKQRASGLIQEHGSSWYLLTAIEGAKINKKFIAKRLSRIDIQVPETSLQQTPITAPASAAIAPHPPPTTARKVVPSRVFNKERPTASLPLPEKAKQRFLALNVTLNGSRKGNWLLLEDQGVLYVPEEAFAAWRVLSLPRVEPTQRRGQRWYPLSAVDGFESKFNLDDQSVELRFSPEVFATSAISTATPPRLQVTPAIPAVFANYDVAYTKGKNNESQTNSQNLGAVLELGYSNSFGVLTSGYEMAGLIHGDDPKSRSNWRRLNTSFSKDFPEKNLSLLVGDGYTRPDFAGRALNFGGLQIGSNYGLTSGFVTQARPFATGVASSPSVVELYVDEVLQQTSRVPTGPFMLTNLPLLNGGGHARIVVRDYLGREILVEQDFFTHGSLLEKGLSEWSYELGAARANADYGLRFTSGFYRYGVTKLSTLEGRAQVAKGIRNFGMGLSQGLPLQMFGQLFLAQSRDQQAGNGKQTTALLAYSSRRQNFIVRAESTGLFYKQIGQADPFSSTKSQWSVNYNYRHPIWGTWGAGVAQLQPYYAKPTTVQNLNYTTKIGQQNSLTVRLTRTSGALQSRSLSVMLTIALDKGRTIASGLQFRDGKNNSYVAVNEAQTGEMGMSYRALLGTQQGQPYSGAGVYYQGGKGRLAADVSASRALQSLQLGASGGFAMADGQFFAARRIDGSFGVVEVPGYANIGIGFQGDSLTRTNASGIAILPRMMAYNSNYVRLNIKELPISAEIDNIEQVVVPGTRSAVKVLFPVRSGRGALIKLVLDDGQPAPAGAEVELVNDKHEFFVARRGEVFVTGLQNKNEIRLKHKQQSCTVSVELPAASAGIDEIIRLGPLLCSGVKR